MNLSFKPWGIAVLCGVGAFALASVMFMQGWLPVSSQAETTTQTAPVPAPAAAPPPAVPVAAPVAPASFTQAQLDQWVAPVALYPDSLLSQVLMASTYPTNVIQAVQWSRDHPQSQGDAAVTQVANEPWDPSVKSLVAFPQLLALLGEDPAWVQNLGNAFLAQPDDVMNTVQKFREVAQKSGALKSTPQQTVTVKPKPASTTVVKSAPAQQTIVIESADPQVVYVPSYNPNVVYGAWPTPAYPPVYLPPPPGQQFVNGMASGIGFGVGVAATYAIFGSIDWDDDDHHHDDYDHHDDHHDDGHHGGSQNNYVNVNVNNYNRISGNNNNGLNHPGASNTAGWQHNPAYNAGLPNRTANLNGATQNRALNNAAQRNNYRGFDNDTRGFDNNSRGISNNNAVGRNGGGVQNQNLDQRRQQAASVMNQHQNTPQAQAHTQQRNLPRSAPAANAGDRAGTRNVTGHQLPQHQQSLSQHNTNRQPSQQLNQHQRQNLNASHSTAFSGNSSRSPSWQQQQSRGNQSREHMQNFQRSRPANAESAHLHRR